MILSRCINQVATLLAENSLIEIKANFAVIRDVETQNFASLHMITLIPKSQNPNPEGYYLSTTIFITLTSSSAFSFTKYIPDESFAPSKVME